MDDPYEMKALYLMSVHKKNPWFTKYCPSQGETADAVLLAAKARFAVKYKPNYKCETFKFLYLRKKNPA